MVRLKKQPKVSLTVDPPMVGGVSTLFRGPTAEVARLFAKYGLESVQIHPNGQLPKDGPICSSDCRELSQPFLEAGMTIAGVSAYTNFLDPQGSRRRRNIKQFDAIIEHAKDFSSPYVITESGTLAADRPWVNVPENRAPEALAQFRKNLAPSVKLAEQLGVTILLKGYLYHAVYSIDVAIGIHEHFGPAVGFVMDPANYFTRNMASASTTFLRRMFEKIGHLCPIAHGKDVRYVGGTLTTPRTGTGNLDYKEFLELLHEYQPRCPLILEQIRPEELRETLDFLDRFFD